MKSVLKPEIEVFNPFVKPFAEKHEEVDNNAKSYVIVKPEVKRYMRSGHKRLEIVAKCTPCQCCACR